MRRHTLGVILQLQSRETRAVDVVGPKVYSGVFVYFRLLAKYALYTKFLHLSYN